MCTILTCFQRGAHSPVPGAAHPSTVILCTTPVRRGEAPASPRDLSSHRHTGVTHLGGNSWHVPLVTVFLEGRVLRGDAQLVSHCPLLCDAGAQHSWSARGQSSPHGGDGAGSRQASTLRRDASWKMPATTKPALWSSAGSKVSPTSCPRRSRMVQKQYICSMSRS